MDEPAAFGDDGDEANIMLENDKVEVLIINEGVEVDDDADDNDDGASNEGVNAGGDEANGDEAAGTPRPGAIEGVVTGGGGM